jgi:hypothetical protein
MSSLNDASGGAIRLPVPFRASPVTRIPAVASRTLTPGGSPTSSSPITVMPRSDRWPVQGHRGQPTRAPPTVQDCRADSRPPPERSRQVQEPQTLSSHREPLAHLSQTCILRPRVIREHEPEAFHSPRPATFGIMPRPGFESFHVDPLAAEEVLRCAILWHTRGATDDGIV